MPTTYERCDEDVINLCLQVMREHHAMLEDLGVQVTLLYAHADVDSAGEPKGPALKHGGYPAAATVRINNSKERVLGNGDALICLDGDKWSEYGDEVQKAILDHELEHLKVKTDKNGDPKFDAIGRPALRIERHDFQFGGFWCVMERHRMSSLEAQNAEAVVRVAQSQYQMKFDFTGSVPPVLETSEV